MLSDLIASLLVTILVLVMPGYFWARVFLPAIDWLESIAFALALSLAMVPAVAWLLSSLFGSALTLVIALASVLIVTASGAVAYWKLGRAPAAPLLSKQELPTLEVAAMAPLFLGVTLIVLVSAYVIASDDADSIFTDRFWSIPIALLMVATVTVQVLSRRRQGVLEELPHTDKTHWQSEAEDFESVQPRSPAGVAQRILRWLTARQTLLGGTLVLVLVRGYVGPVRYDWPFIRGADNYVHAIMTDMVLKEGSAEGFSLYPPGFHILGAVMSRLSGLGPLELYPLLAPALLLLPALGCYVLAQRLFGAWCGLVAAAFAGILLISPWRFIQDGTYVDVIAAQFLLVLIVLSLVMLLLSPSARNVILTALLGSAVVLYHTITTLYLILLLTLFALIALPYLWRGERRKGLGMLVSLGLLGLLSVAYAWDPYDLPETIAGIFGWSQATVTVDRASMVLGTQPPLSLADLPRYLSFSVVNLGLLGVLLLAANLRRMLPTYLVANLLLLGWLLIFFVGSRTTFSAFPWRFTRDLGIPLSVMAAVAFVCILRSFNRHRLLSVLTVSMVSLLVVLQARQSLVNANAPSRLLLMARDLQAAGEWLRAHNEGGAIITNAGISQAMLAVSGYRGLSSVSRGELQDQRIVPPSEREKAEDVLWVYDHPGSRRAAEILDKYDVRYIALVKVFPSHINRRRRDKVSWRRYAATKKLYEVAFENKGIIVFKVREPPNKGP